MIHASAATPATPAATPMPIPAPEPAEIPDDLCGVSGLVSGLGESVLGGGMEAVADV
jgi:hypothetical protein